jgi:2-polyprenyl-3-methyl-5-hydroxy-6-metoxy-1,4-benzoquinol methylase
MSVADNQHLADRAATLRNRERLERNKNLLYWYRRLYRDQFSAFARPDELAILEIGSGVSPLSRFHPTVLTSDVMELDYVDYVFDAHDIDQLTGLEDESLDLITLTNVLHHLEKPLVFLHRATTKLKPGGRIVATEPYFSLLSTWIFK